MGNPFRKIQTSNYELSKVQDNIALSLQPFITNPLLDGGVLAEGLAIISGVNIINHGLGRKLRGWLLTRLSAQVSIWDTQALNKTPERTLLLNSSGPAVVSLYVF